MTTPLTKARQIAQYPDFLGFDGNAFGSEHPQFTPTTFLVDASDRIDLKADNQISLDTPSLESTSNFITLNSPTVGLPSENAGIMIDRGALPDVGLRWNEAADQWEFSNDGIVWTAMGAGAEGGFSATTISLAGVLTGSGTIVGDGTSVVIEAELGQVDGGVF